MKINIMERVATLIDKLREQLEQGASAEKLILTTQMLQAELQKSSHSAKNNGSSRVAVIMPSSVKYFPETQASATTTAEAKSDIVSDHVLESAEEPVKEEPVAEKIEEKEEEEEKIVEVLEVDEDEIAAELEEIKRNAEAKNQMSLHTNTNNATHFDNLDDIPTLTHQRHQHEQAKEINDIAETSPVSLNDRLKETRVELSEKLTDSPIRDLRKAIGINDRFLFINELFRGDEAMYERSIKTINNFSILPEAEYWIQRELKVKIGWSEQNDVVKQFDQLVRRRFS